MFGGFCVENGRFRHEKGFLGLDWFLRSIFHDRFFTIGFPSSVIHFGFPQSVIRNRFSTIDFSFVSEMNNR